MHYVGNTVDDWTEVEVEMVVVIGTVVEVVVEHTDFVLLHQQLP